MGEEIVFTDSVLVWIGQSDLESVWVLYPSYAAYQFIGKEDEGGSCGQ